MTSTPVSPQTLLLRELQSEVLAQHPPLVVPETSTKGGERTISRAPADLSAKLQQAFDGLLGEESLGSFEEMARKESNCHT